MGVVVVVDVVLLLLTLAADTMTERLRGVIIPLSRLFPPRGTVW